MGTGDPKHPLPFPFAELTDDEFDELVHLVAHTTDGHVVKTRAPDGGLDTVRLNLRDPGRTIAKPGSSTTTTPPTWSIAQRGHRGPLRTAEDLLEREGTTGEFLRTAGPHFDFHTINRPWSEAEPPRTPNAAMRLQFRRGQQQLIVDAVPRNAAALLEYGPKGSAQFDDHDRALELLHAVQSHGGRANLGSGNLRFERVPPPFDALLSEIAGVVTVRSTAPAEPLPARSAAQAADGPVVLDIDLAPVATALREFRRSGNDIEIRDEMVVTVFGRELVVADRVARLPPMQLVAATRLTAGKWQVEMIPVAGDEAPMAVEYLRPAVSTPRGTQAERPPAR